MMVITCGIKWILLLPSWIHTFLTWFKRLKMFMLQQKLSTKVW